MSGEKTIQAELATLEGINSVYFIGIGGIGMSAIARYFHSNGMTVSGYDKTPTVLSRQLQQEGISVHYEENVEAIPKQVELVVYTPAIPAQHKELVYYRDNNYKVVKRSDVLKAISANSFNICVAGTHGKTTVSTMIAHILRHSGYGCNAFLGGISANYGTNFWAIENSRNENTDHNTCVIEADEYDRSFLKLNPDIAVITAMDADHLDIYGDEASMQKAFIEFGNKVKPSGILYIKFGLKNSGEIKTKKLTYSLQNDAADIYADEIRIEQGGYIFNARLKQTVLNKVELKVGGMHNVENVLVALAIAADLKISDEKIKAAIADFKGVRRRFEYIIPPRVTPEGGYVQPVLIDDYAHHPEELKALLNSVRSLFPQRVLTVVFQPHLYSRTRDFADGFANVLSTADNLILLPIYPAREMPIEGVNSEMIIYRTDGNNKQVLSKQNLLEWMKDHQLNKEFGEVVVMAGAGDIDALVQPLKEIIESK